MNEDMANRRQGSGSLVSDTDETVIGNLRLDDNEANEEEEATADAHGETNGVQDAVNNEGTAHEGSGDSTMAHEGGNNMAPNAQGLPFFPPFQQPPPQQAFGHQPFHQQPSTQPVMHQNPQFQMMDASVASPSWHSSPGHEAPPPLPQGHPGLLQYYETQMRNHAAAYANAAVAAAMTAAQIAASHQSPTSHHPLSQGAPFFAPLMPSASAQPPGLAFHPPQNMAYYSPQANHPDGSPHFYGGPPAQGSAGNFQKDCQNHGNHRRRKRHQHVNHDTSDGRNGHQGRGSQRRRNVENFDSDQPSIPHQFCNQLGQEKRGRRRRWNWSDGGSSESDPSFRTTASSSNNHNNKRNSTGSNRRRNRKTALASSSSDGGSASWTTKKKKQKQQLAGDENLLGKTGSGALYEWCDKRKIKPVFECTCVTTLSSSTGKQERKAKQLSSQTSDSEQSSDEEENEESLGRISTRATWYEMKVYIDGIAMGEGRGSTKTGAKHDASRNALQVLFPGVKFDRSSGIIVKIPVETPIESSSRLGQWSTTAASRQNDPTSTTSTCLDELAPNLAKQLAIGHPDEEDDTADNESSDPSALGTKRRGQWPYVYPGTSTTSDDEDDDAYWASRGASVCSSLLHAMIQIDDRLSDPPEYFYEMTNFQVKRNAGVPIDATRSDSRGAFQCTGMLKIRVSEYPSSLDVDSLETFTPRESYQLLRAVGFGATKRESRHIAAAKLLALLFPECDGMAQVKHAAEAARERYAAGRALKQELKQDQSFTAVNGPNDVSPTNASDCISPNFSFALPSEGVPPIPEVIEVALASAMRRAQKGTAFDDSTCAPKLVPSGFSGHIRQLSRQQQLEEKVASALQMLNEHDDEGRSLPEELTVDDVGRTVLRRATVDDLTWIEDLFGAKSVKSRVISKSPLNVLGINKRSGSMPLQLWSSSTIVLLLCRAIAPHEDPPLGCAVLNVGFSMRQGKLLRLAQIASQPHLPKERFIECLLSFANCMGSVLDASRVLETSFTVLRKESIRQIVASHLPIKSHPDKEEKVTRNSWIRSNAEISRSLDDTLVQPALQSVQEEENEGYEESDCSQKKKSTAKPRDKPSKRSRFE